MGPRALNAVVGLWLFFSTFIVARTPAQRRIGWVVGALAVIGALLGRSGAKLGRYLNAVLGGWLILFAILLPRAQAATFWNDLLAGFAMVLLALVTSTADLRRRKPADV